MPRGSKQGHRALSILALLSDTPLTADEVLTRLQIAPDHPERGHWVATLPNLVRQGRATVAGMVSYRWPRYVITEAGRQTLAGRAA